MWTMNFQRSKLDLERAEYQISNCQHPLDHQTKQEFRGGGGNLLKSRDITLSTKVYLVKDMAFAAVLYGCERWTIKKAERQRMMLLNCGVWEDSWESLGLQVDQTSQINEIRPEYTWEGLMMKLKLQYFGYLMWRPDWLENTLMLGKIEGWRQEEKVKTEDEMFRWNPWLDGLSDRTELKRKTKIWTLYNQRIFLMVSVGNQTISGIHMKQGLKTLFMSFSLVQLSCSVMSGSLRPRESQHARPPCPSPTPGVYSNSCP